MTVISHFDIVDKARHIIASETDRLRNQLEKVCLDIHSHPELCYEEIFAHDTICNFLEANGFPVTRHAYGIPTCFEAEIGAGDHFIIYCAEYDALPGIGHACGHNLIALSSITAFVTAAKVANDLGLIGRIRILGTPAEEGGGGKIRLLDVGAFEGAAAALMSHPTSMGRIKEVEGLAGAAGLVTVAASKLTADFFGKSAHAGATPWQGRNALDAAVGSYVNISMLRQQIKPAERIHGVITNGGEAPNIIPEKTSMVYSVRGRTADECSDLIRRVTACFEAAATATACKVETEVPFIYKDQILNSVLCETFTHEMALLGDEFLPMAKEAVSASTDMGMYTPPEVCHRPILTALSLSLGTGNVSHVVPSFHCSYGIRSGDASNHTPGFTAAAGTPDAIDRAIRVGRGLAMLGIRVLIDGDLRQRVSMAFKKAT
ncbi:amidohydrolase [Fusarium beomiforme]|uniref:Peptidase M20 domain-containing protein 2 n=1 Tax=Fusarium beomiforme TaxID=44412 RepID=A0A9P5E7H6_9HYPO|nr:amidohydrolase [Fusarium beomiforme]